MAGDIGPCGHLLAPMGTADPDAVGAAFFEQAQALVAAGVDLLNIETMFDLTEARLAVEAACAAFGGRPVLASMAFRPAAKGYRTMMGVDPATAVATLRAAGATLVGCNCEVNAEQMADLVPQLAELNGGVTYAQPNARAAAPQGRLNGLRRDRGAFRRDRRRLPLPGSRPRRRLLRARTRGSSRRWPRRSIADVCPRRLASRACSSHSA